MHVLAIALASLASLASAQNLVWLTTPGQCVGTNGAAVINKPLTTDDFCATFSVPASISNSNIKNPLTGWCLTVSGNTVTTINSNIVLSTCFNTTGQRYTRLSSGALRVFNTNNCVAVGPSGGVVLRSCSAPGAGYTLAKFSPENRPKSILIRHKDFNHKCAGGVTRPKKVLGIAQRCSIFQADKLDRLLNVATGFCTDVFGGNVNAVGSASTIGIYNCSTSAINQRWTLGRFNKKIKAAATGNCLDVDWLTNKLSLVPCANAKMEWYPSVGPVDPPARRFSPYLKADQFNLDIGQAVKSQNLKYVTFAFIVNNAGKPSWGGAYDILPGQGNPTINQRIVAARSNGAEVIASFGGPVGVELSAANRTAAQLLSAYRVLIDFYGIRQFDFNIQGSTLANANATVARLAAVESLLSIYSNLEFIYTLPVGSTGFAGPAISFIQAAVNAAQPPALINLLTQNYTGSQPNLANTIVLSSVAAHMQLKALGLAVDIGITPMIGVNGGTGVFSLDNADAVVEFAKSTSWVSLLSFWSINRDNGNNSNNIDSSKIQQQLLEFTSKFSEFTS
ncbi:hypothetical protein BC831DRAFT_504334 [Entophlyctis helioformis]|nr:hypothetical protein BC831DRAFT_504334 [Entophlyctis helioformis]